MTGLLKSRITKSVRYQFSSAKILRFLELFFDSLAKLDWRSLWYGLFLWLISTIIAGFIILPWFYPVIIIYVFCQTAFFFRKIKRYRLNSRNQDKILKKGIVTSFFWALVVLFLDALVISGINFPSLVVYFLDPRTWFKYPLIILMPLTYSLVLENFRKAKLAKELEQEPNFVIP